MYHFYGAVYSSFSQKHFALENYKKQIGFKTYSGNFENYSNKAIIYLLQNEEPFYEKYMFFGSMYLYVKHQKEHRIRFVDIVEDKELLGAFLKKHNVEQIKVCRNISEPYDYIDLYVRIKSGTLYLTDDDFVKIYFFSGNLDVLLDLKITIPPLFSIDMLERCVDLYDRTTPEYEINMLKLIQNNGYNFSYRETIFDDKLKQLLVNFDMNLFDMIVTEYIVNGTKKFCSQKTEKYKDQEKQYISIVSFILKSFGKDRFAIQRAIETARKYNNPNFLELFEQFVGTKKQKR